MFEFSKGVVFISLALCRGYQVPQSEVSSSSSQCGLRSGFRSGASLRMPRDDSGHVV